MGRGVVWPSPQPPGPRGPPPLPRQEAALGDAQLIPWVFSPSPQQEPGPAPQLLHHPLGAPAAAPSPRQPSRPPTPSRGAADRGRSGCGAGRCADPPHPRHGASQRRTEGLSPGTAAGVGSRIGHRAPRCGHGCPPITGTGPRSAPRAPTHSASTPIASGQLLCRAMPCCAMPCRAVPCHAVLCHAVPCRAMPRCWPGDPSASPRASLLPISSLSSSNFPDD